MSDGTDNRAPKPFEPPPWEREQFEELRRRREEAEAAQRSADEAEMVREEGPELEAAAALAELAVEQMREPIAGHEVAVSSEEAAAQEASGQERAEKEKNLDPRVADAMILQLSAEDPNALKPVKRASMWFAYVVAAVAVLCTGLMVVSLVVFLRDGSTVFGFGAAMLGVIGVFCGGVAAWLYFLAKR
jgi:hypothetical protein